MLFTLYAHAVGFPAYFSTSTPSFRSRSARLASGVVFSACFFLCTPTSWVFSFLHYFYTQFSLRIFTMNFWDGFSTCPPLPTPTVCISILVYYFHALLLLQNRVINSRNVFSYYFIFCLLKQKVSESRDFL